MSKNGRKITGDWKDRRDNVGEEFQFLIDTKTLLKAKLEKLDIPSLGYN